jgi:hypothetical protein
MDKQEDWETVSVKSDKPKNSSNENVYILSDLINCGACLRCLSSNCHMTEKHGVFIPDKIKIFIKNPLYINEIKKMIDKEKNIMAGIETCNDVIPIFTTCGFTHSKKGCRNCIDGRMKQIRLNDEELTICYSIVKPNITKSLEPYIPMWANIAGEPIHQRSSNPYSYHKIIAEYKTILYSCLAVFSLETKTNRDDDNKILWIDGIYRNYDRYTNDLKYNCIDF